MEFTNKLWDFSVLQHCKLPLVLNNAATFTIRLLLTLRKITESDADPLARSLSAEKSPEDWLRAVEDCAVDPSIVITVGPSSTGKSIFAKRLLNRYLTGQGKAARPLPAVCYLDIDPEKPEYTPHGQISLVVVRSLNLGPSFTQSTTPSSPLDTEANSIVRSHCMPTSLVNHREYYRACAEDLFLAYKALQSHDPSLPLVISTSGSLYSSDFDLLINLLARFKPHYAIHMSDIQAIDTEQATKLHSLQTTVSQYRGTVHEITAQAPASLAMRTDADLRAMYMQSYFHCTKSNRNGPGIATWTSNSISQLVPWEFCFEETEERTQDFVGFAMYSEPVEPMSLVQSLNGLIVQIVESTSSAIPTPYVSLPRTRKYSVPYFAKSDQTGMVEPLDPRTSKLICTAMVRGFDAESKMVQILVPKSHENLLHNLSPERTVFVGGCCEPPEWAYLEDANAATCTPWLEEDTRMDNMGYLNTVRRVRKFQT
jgi:polynucleotide 5'-hydroxyl-kinase GRC3/NOL9